MELLFKSLHEHPGRFGRRELQAKLAAVACDGAGTRGGENSQRASTGAAELFWQALHPNANTDSTLPTHWDLFHRLELVVHKAIESSPSH